MVTLTDTDIIRASWLDPDEFDYTHPDNHTSPTYDMTHASKPFTKLQPA